MEEDVDWRRVELNTAPRRARADTTGARELAGIESAGTP